MPFVIAAAVPSSGDPLPGRFYRPELDGLRFLAFMAVFLHHALPRLPAGFSASGPVGWAGHLYSSMVLGGGLGVDLFFTLSAYLITTLLVREHRHYGNIDWRLFLARRALRIWPLYYAFLLCAPVLARLGWERPLSGGQFAAFALLAANWECALHGYPASMVAPLWSVAIEEQFYLVWPIAVRWTKPERLAKLCVAMLVVAAGTRAYLAWIAVPHPGVWCNTLARLDPIAIGSLLAVLPDRWQRPFPKRWRAPVALAAVASCLAIVAVWPMTAKPPSMGFVPSYALIALACVVVLRSAFHEEHEPPSGLAHPWLIHLGRISYGLYVFHAFGLMMARDFVGRLTGGQMAVVVTPVIGLAVTTAIAAMSYRFLEQPFLRLKSRLARVPSRAE